MAWPRLREELTLHPAPTAVDGAPAWSLHDPVRNQFFRINWPVFEILNRWGMMSLEKIAESINTETALELATEDVEEVSEFLSNNQLLAIDDLKGIAKLSEIKNRGKKNWSSWLLHNYLFFRVPLIKPDMFLERTYPKIEWIFSRWIAIAICVAGVLGLYLVGRQWDVYLGNFSLAFSPAGFLGYAVTLVLVKFIHELGHAYTAKRYGCRVPNMGVAFLVLFPMLYTDVNDSWKLASRKARLAVGVGGITVELSFACLASLAWVFLPDGTLRNSMFVLSSVTWISTLLINLNPFMRFDGYFLMSDWLEIPNLHSRSFALGRWWLREKLFGLGLAPPERFPPARERGLIIFAFSVWLYRLVLFLGIAALVYQFFIKALGIILFAAEIGWFILKPVTQEMSVWWKNRGVITKTGRTHITLAFLGLIIALMFIPLNTHVTAQSVLRGHQIIELFAPGAARITSIEQKEGGHLANDQIIMRLENPDLGSEEKILESRVAATELEMLASSFDKSLQQKNLTINETLAQRRAELNGIRQEMTRYDVLSPIDGRYINLSPDIQTGQWVGENERLGAIADYSTMEVEAFLTEETTVRVMEGNDALFYPEDPSWPVMKATVTSVDHFATKALKQPTLASLYGGDVPVHDQDGELVPDRAAYRVILSVDPTAEPVNHLLRGNVVILGEPESIMGRMARFALAVLIRESGF